MKIAVLGTLAATMLLTACATQGTQAPSTTAATTAGASASAPVPGSEDDLVKNVGDRVLFEFNRSLLTPEDTTILDRQAAWLARYPQDNVQIAGNCDERGTEEYNIVLGSRRAYTVRMYLQARGVAATRITTISYGKDRPVALGSDEASLAQNRNAITSVK